MVPFCLAEWGRLLVVSWKMLGPLGLLPGESLLKLSVRFIFAGGCGRFVALRAKLLASELVKSLLSELCQRKTPSSPCLRAFDEERVAKTLISSGRIFTPT